MLVTLKLISRDINMRMKMASHRKPFHNCLMHHSIWIRASSDHIQCESTLFTPGLYSWIGISHVNESPSAFFLPTEKTEKPLVETNHSRVPTKVSEGSSFWQCLIYTSHITFAPSILIPALVSSHSWPAKGDFLQPLQLHSQSFHSLP